MAGERVAADALTRVTDPLALLRGLFEHSPVAYAIFARAGHLVLANPAYVSLFGRLPPPAYNLFEDEETRRSGVAEQVERAFQGTTVQTPTFWYDPQGLAHVSVAGANRVAISCTFFPLRSETGKIDEIAIAYKDVTAELVALECVEAREREARELSNQLAAQMSLHRAVIEHSGDGVVVADAEGVVRIFNPAAARQHGVAAIDVPYERWTHTFNLHRLDRTPLPLAETPLFRALHGERVDDARWLVRRKDSFRVLTGTATPLRYPDGSSAGAVLITRDETERLALEEQLRTALEREQRERETLGRTEAEYRAIFELAAAGMAQADPRSEQLLRVNQRLCELVGHTQEELLQKTLSELAHPEDRARQRAVFASMAQGDEPPPALESRYARKDGSFIWLQITGTLVRDAAGQATSAIFVLLDVTERRRVEEHARAISDNATVGLFMMDDRQQCVFMNPAAEQITGFHFEELQGKPLHEFIHHTRPDGSHYPIEECPIDRAFPEERQTRGEDVFVHKAGHFYPVAFTASPLHDANGRTRGTVIELRDTTVEKRAEIERERLLRELELAVRVRDEFLSIASHEIRTPLTALMLNLQTLARMAQREIEREEHGRFQVRVERALDNSQRLQRLIEELLDVTRIASSRLVLEREEVDLAELVRMLAQRLHEQAARTATELRVRTPKTMRGYLDRFRIEQVVSNLLTNALKYGQGQPVDIDLEEQDGRALLRVRDRGIGIDPENHARIFERFERAVSIRHYGGFGLGLWIARQVVEASGGTIRVESQPGRGSVFTVDLPLRAPA